MTGMSTTIEAKYAPKTRREKSEAARSSEREASIRARVERASVDIARAFNRQRAPKPADPLPDIYDGRLG